MGLLYIITREIETVEELIHSMNRGTRGIEAQSKIQDFTTQIIGI